MNCSSVTIYSETLSCIKVLLGILMCATMSHSMRIGDQYTVRSLTPCSLMLQSRIRPVFMESLKHLNSVYTNTNATRLYSINCWCRFTDFRNSCLYFMGVPFAGKILREDTILGSASVRPAGSVNASTQVIDTSRPLSLAIHVERNNVTAAGQIPNNNLRETVRNPNGIIMTSNEFTGAFFTTFKPDMAGKYTVTIYNLGHTPVSVDVLVGNLPFVGANNYVKLNSSGGII